MLEDSLELRYSLRQKKNRTDVEEYFLNYHHTLAIISDILVEESKRHITSYKAVRDIRDCINNHL